MNQGMSLRMRLAAIGAAGAIGYAVLYFFDRELGEERRRRVLEAAQGALQEALALSYRLTANLEQPAEPTPAGPERAPETDLAESLRDSVSFFRPGDEEEPELEHVATPVAVTVSVIGEQREAEVAGSSIERPYSPPAALPPTIIAYDTAVDRRHEPEPEPEPVSAPPPVAADPPAERRAPRTALLAAAVVGVLLAAAAIGAWAIWGTSDHSSSTSPSTPAGVAQAISLISQPGAHSVAVGNSRRSMVLVVTKDGRAALIVSGLKRAPKGKEYQAWIVTGKTPHSAGVFQGSGSTRIVIPLSGRLPRGAIFAVTVEKAGGVPAPTMAPEYTAKLS